LGERGEAEVDGGVFIAEGCLGELGGGDADIIWEGREVHVRDLYSRVFYDLILLEVLKPNRLRIGVCRKKLYTYLLLWQ
jgi:hypothetical protein